jgi:bacterial/archaeal transporter family-2 protein
VTAAYAALCITAGIAGTLQVAVMGRLGERIGTVEALAFAALVTAALTFAVLVTVRFSLDGYAAAVRQPRWLWLGGFLGALIVFTITLVSPRLGTFATIGVIVAGQLAMGAVIDRFGLFGFERIPLSWSRFTGLVLLGAGALLILRR